MIVGIDEVGRGAWAGPLCIAAVGLGGAEIDGLTDSKKLTKKKRAHYERIIKQSAPLIGIGWVSARQLDKIGMSDALKLAARRALAQIDCSDITQIIIDGTIMLLDDTRATTMKQADLLVPSVSAASVIAKEARDRYMRRCDHAVAGYSFTSHVGYGTATHQAAIATLGPSPLHRMSFAPLANKTIIPQVPKAVSEGSIAERAASEYLQSLGYRIIDENWKTKWCEIDIIALKDDRVHFVEVKYRRVSTWGSGLQAITPKKLKQMDFAARLWLSKQQYETAVLSGISVSGDTFAVDDYIDVIV